MISAFRYILVACVIAIFLVVFTSGCVIVNSSFVNRGTEFRSAARSEAGAITSTPTIGETSLMADKTTTDSMKAEGNSAQANAQLGLNK